MKNRRRKLASIPSYRWLAYSTAATATAFAGADSAQARIHYSGRIDKRFYKDTNQHFQLDKVGDFLLFIHTDGWAYFTVNALQGASFAGSYPCASGYGTALIASVWRLNWRDPISAQSFVIGARDFEHTGVMQSDSRRACGGGNRGQFFDAGTAFIGFRFNNRDGLHYGWARVEMKGSNADYTVRDYAWGDPGDRVRAGQGIPGDAPELESLGVLALGAVGVRAWRKRNALLAQ